MKVSTCVQINKSRLFYNYALKVCPKNKKLSCHVDISETTMRHTFYGIFNTAAHYNFIPKEIGSVHVSF